jgi:hypothetical protein
LIMKPSNVCIRCCRSREQLRRQVFKREVEKKAKHHVSRQAQKFIDIRNAREMAI